MGLQFIESVEGFNPDQFPGIPGRAKGILVVAEGTNNVGQQGTLADIGDVIITRNGSQTHNRGSKQFADMADIRGGTNVLSSTDGGVFEGSFYIPFFEIGFPNALNIRGKNEMNFRFQPKDDGTIFADITVNFYADIAQLPESYQYKVLGNDVSYNASRSGVPETLSEENISSLYLEEQSGQIDLVQFEQNDKVQVSAIDFTTLKAKTIYENRIEDSTFSIVQIMAATPGVRGSVRGWNSKLSFTTTGGTDIGITTCSMEWGNNPK